MFLLSFCVKSLLSFMWGDMHHFTTVEVRIKILLHCASVPSLVFVPV